MYYRRYGSSVIYVIESMRRLATMCKCTRRNLAQQEHLDGRHQEAATKILYSDSLYEGFSATFLPRACRINF